MRHDELLGELTLEEKASLTAGADMWRTVAIERAGIPALKMTDGPNGARGDALLGAGSETALCVPCGSALGATWNPVLVERVGAALGEEARTKACRILLAPTINLHRSPLGGRNFECYSEDPLLSGKTAAAFVRGVQSRGVAATAKHFVANDAEHQRYTTSSRVDERALREIYLVPFELAVREGGVLAIMTGYNRLNGTYCSEHAWLLESVLRRDWGFSGIVMTDWFSSGDTVASAKAGLDLQMPGPGRFFGAALGEAVRAGTVDGAVLDAAIGRLLGVIDRLRAWEDPADAAERSVEKPEHRALARETACEAAVLLANDGILPLDASRLRSVALLGPNWGRAHVMGGGSASLRPHRRPPPLEAMRARLGDGCRVLHHPGCIIDRTTRPMNRGVLRTPEGEPGIAVEIFPNLDLAGPPAKRVVFDETRIAFFGPPAEGVAAREFSMRARAVFTPERSGAHVFSLVQAGRARVLVDGKVVLDGVTDPPPMGTLFLGMASEERLATVELAEGSPVEIVIEYASREALLLRGVQVGHRPPVEEDPIGSAAALAAEADVAIVLVGTSDEWESEGHDRRSMDLPGAQDELVARVRAANPRTVVVLNTGAPVTADWAGEVAAVLQVWLGGQEMADALADVLLGAAEPAGRLPTTFPLRLEHNPSFGNFPGENGEVLYGEGVLVGYRWYDTRRLPVRWPFGHGLSYTTFAIGEPRVASREHAPGRPLVVEVPVTNTGGRRGAEVVQCYVAPPAGALTRPAKELRAFEKVWLDPGASAIVRLVLDDRAFAYWDPGAADQQSLRAKLGPTASFLPGGSLDLGRSEAGWWIDAGEHELHVVPIRITAGTRVA